MVGSKGVQTRSEVSKGGGIKTRGGGVKPRGGRSGGGGRSNCGRSSGDVHRSNLVISASGGSNNRPDTEIHGKGIMAESHGKGRATGDGTPPAPKATHRPSSSQSYKPSGPPSPPSQGTTQSAGNVSVSWTIPLHYPASSFQVNLHPVIEHPIRTAFRFRIMFR